MKKFLVVAAAVVFLVMGRPVANAQDTGVTGKWHFVFETPGGDREVEADFTVDTDGNVTGKWGASDVAGTYKDGKLALDFQFTSEEVGDDRFHEDQRQARRFRSSGRRLGVFRVQRLIQGDAPSGGCPRARRRFQADCADGPSLVNESVSEQRPCSGMGRALNLLVPNLLWRRCWGHIRRGRIGWNRLIFRAQVCDQVAHILIGNGIAEGRHFLPAIKDLIGKFFGRPGFVFRQVGECRRLLCANAAYAMAIRAALVAKENRAGLLFLAPFCCVQRAGQSRRCDQKKR